MADRYTEHARSAMAAVKRLSKGGKKNFTASETGARRNAIKNMAQNPGLSAMVERGSKNPTPKGSGGQFRAVESEDIEKMIRRGR